MAPRFWILEEQTAGYRLGSPTAEPLFQEIVVARETSPADVAAQVQQVLAAQGYRGEPLILALDSLSCLVAIVPHTGRSMARNPQAMSYALEEFLPLAAEEATCDFVAFAEDALGVAVETAPLVPLVTALAEVGVRITSIVPAALLVLQGQLLGRRWRNRQAVLWQDQDRIEVLELMGGRPHAWRSFAATSQDLVRELQVLGLFSQESPVEELFVGGLDEGLQEALRPLAGGVPTTVLTEPPEKAALTAAAAIVSGRQEPWIELSRGELGSYDPYRSIRTSLRVATFASVCLLLALALAAWLRASQFEALAQGFQEEQERLFRQTLPGAKVPVGIRSRLESEYRTLAGVTGQMEGVPRLDSAAALLWEALSALPENLRFRVEAVRVEQNHFHLDAEIRQHGDADLLATALREHGLEVPVPRTEQLGDKGIGLVIDASRPSPEAQSKKQGATP